ncbi:hypothetical protein [Methylobacterium nonmethylotrophicum]|uniref:Uncharacterized protein n=1 Tax=Methylobacterium nonmethylotrophicum TaxID=1141884 RepID=A0A4Z0NPH3_9HYPH|nr:hypothetical protein [Methylobacterium nonmethylotrophicum]TGD98073.1 hypothetical protein EU555_18170 [Methylobacterium nonmethylotrophicum]
MTARAPKPLPPPTMQERAAAAIAAQALRAVIADHTKLGTRSVMHVDMSRPRRGVWIEWWSGVPGFRRENGRYEHDLLPGWSYTRAEIKAEMIPDLEALAERGERPTVATSGEGSR